LYKIERGMMTIPSGQERFIASFDRDSERNEEEVSRACAQASESRKQKFLEALRQAKTSASDKDGIIYTPMTMAAMRIAFETHKEQKDKSGLPYIFHPMRIAERVRGEAAVCAALLHDVLEDTDMKPEDLALAGISDESSTS
jgi:(p)ppGpp synthase/HD superfamily hydrolase